MKQRKVLLLSNFYVCCILTFIVLIFTYVYIKAITEGWSKFFESNSNGIKAKILSMRLQSPSCVDFLTNRKINREEKSWALKVFALYLVVHQKTLGCDGDTVIFGI